MSTSASSTPHDPTCAACTVSARYRALLKEVDELGHDLRQLGDPEQCRRQRLTLTVARVLQRVRVLEKGRQCRQFALDLIHGRDPLASRRRTRRGKNLQLLMAEQTRVLNDLEKRVERGAGSGGPMGGESL